MENQSHFVPLNGVYYQPILKIVMNHNRLRMNQPETTELLQTSQSVTLSSFEALTFHFSSSTEDIYALREPRVEVSLLGYLVASF